MNLSKSNMPSGPRALAASILILAALAGPAGAQNYVLRADALLGQGKIFQAETLYYYAARSEPRNATGRLALGRYLASRGALRIGAVLLEEARLFGGDRKVIAEHLAPLYARLGDYRALSSLPSSPLAYAERARAEWLSENSAPTTGPDSVIIPVTAGLANPLGQIHIAVGSDTILATIDVAVNGLVLDTSWASRRGVRVFRSSATPGVSDAAGVAINVGLGGPRGLIRSGVPVKFAPTGSTRSARIGIDVLEDFAPTWDRTGSGATLVLGKGGRAPNPSPWAQRIPIIIRPGDLLLVHPVGGMVSLSSPAAEDVLAARWTFDIRHGEVVVER